MKISISIYFRDSYSANNASLIISVNQFTAFFILFSIKMKGSVGQSEEAQRIMREIPPLQQRYTALGSFLRLKDEKISTDSGKLSDWDLQRDSLACWINSENKRLVSFFFFKIVRF